MKILYFNGCSMVFGKDLVPMTMEQEDDPSYPGHVKRMDLAWPMHTRRELQRHGMYPHTVVNKACSGASMQRIMRTTFHDLAPVNVPTDDVSCVVIGLTEPQRFEYNEEDTWQQVVLVRDSIKYLPRRIRKFSEDVSWYMHQEKPSHEMYLAFILSIQSLCKALGLRWAFAPSLDDDYLTVALRAFPSYRSLLEADHIISGAMYTMCVQRGVPFGSTIHPLHEGHHLWGTHVGKELAELYPSLVGSPAASEVTAQ